MVRISNTILAIFNVITLLVGLAALGAGLYFMAGPNSLVKPCEKGIHTPLMLAGAVLLGVSILGLIGSCCKANFFLFIYLTVVFLLIVGLIGFTIFAFLVTNARVGEVFAKTNATDFQGRLWGRLLGGKHWEEIRRCLVDSNACNSLGGGAGDQKFAEFYQKNFPSQSGCCKPPTSCGFTPVNATFWEAPKTRPKSNDTDCTTWSNLPDTLCYNCKSCQAGLETNVKHQWKTITIVNVCALILCIFVYSIGCCAKTNNRKDGNFNRFRGYNP